MSGELLDGGWCFGERNGRTVKYRGPALFKSIERERVARTQESGGGQPVKARLRLGRAPASATQRRKSRHWWTLARRPSAARPLRLRRPGVTAEAAQPTHTFDLIPKEQVVSLRPACCSLPESAGCRGPRTRSGTWDTRPPAAAGGRPGRCAGCLRRAPARLSPFVTVDLVCLVGA